MNWWKRKKKEKNNEKHIVPICYICSWCKKEIKEELIEVSIQEKPIISHGICHECCQKVYDKWDGKK